MILSHKQIEEMAVAITQDFNRSFYGRDFDEDRNTIRATPIDQLAKDYLGLSVSFARLSSDGSICGLTAYEDTEYEMIENDVRHVIPLKQNQILLDSSFIMAGQVGKQCGKRRFTLAHECAHQIIYQCESDDAKLSYRKQYAARTTYSLRELKTREDWNEWQANALGAAILMPQQEINIAMRRYSRRNMLVSYDGRFTYRDRMVIELICRQLGVSKTAAVIRLRQLGFIEERPIAEFSNPLEVWA